MNAPTEADMPGLWEAVAARMADPSPDFRLAATAWDVVLDITAGPAAFRLHFPVGWRPKNIAETASSVMVAAEHATQRGMAPAEAMRASLSYLVAVSAYAALAVGPTRGRA